MRRSASLGCSTTLRIDATMNSVSGNAFWLDWNEQGYSSITELEGARFSHAVATKEHV